MERMSHIVDMWAMVDLINTNWTGINAVPSLNLLPEYETENLYICAQ